MPRPMTKTSWALVLLLPAFTTPAAQFKFPNQTLTVPDGFTVELSAGLPLVDVGFPGNCPGG